MHPAIWLPSLLLLLLALLLLSLLLTCSPTKTIFPSL
jgi:hypothetical protein